MPERPIRVIVFKPTDRKFFHAQWTDPESGRKKTKSTGHEKRRDAERWAAKLEKELANGELQPNSRLTWKEFRERVKRDLLPEKRESTQCSYLGTMNAVEEHLSPLLVSGINAEAIDNFKSAMREKGSRETTIAQKLRTLKAILRWGHRRKLIRSLPPIEMPRYTKVAAGRPISDAEFLKVIKAVNSVVGDERAASWIHFIQGLWTSGLRIGEAARLTWDNPSLPRVDIERARPMLIISGQHQKSGRDTITPVVPEFLELLRKTPESDRTGFVFNPLPMRVKGPRLTLDAMKHTVASIGKASGVRVNSDRESYVSAHDLRRSFCYRWAKRVLPQVLRVLARHQDVATTLTYYADADADMTFDAVYEAIGTGSANTVANTRKPARKKRQGKTTQPPT